MLCLRCSTKAVAQHRKCVLAALLEAGTAWGGAAAFARGAWRSFVASRSTASAACSNLAHE